MFCTLCGHKWNTFSGKCQNGVCSRSKSGWREAEARRRREDATSPDFIEQTPSMLLDLVYDHAPGFRYCEADYCECWAEYEFLGRHYCEHHLDKALINPEVARAA